METRRFSFVAKINNKIKELSFQVPVENGGVYTNKYCPQDLLTGGISFVTAVNGEILEEFIADCQKQVVAMEAVGQQDTLLDVHIGGLMAVVMDHLARCGRLIFGDLLIYMDVFSLLLEADGLSPDEIRNIYPRVTRTIVDLYPDKVFNTMDLSQFKNSHFDFVLFNLTHK
ncbi:hypothetical protein [Bacteroides caecimuris]|jgi:hypothetical protein|uniref:hypothetical protein n=1 Tax=Bacteroides caecimuris TaxID=1796613 RepID=UPI002649C38E|nr:hypothetical protein [Bacteroides caecimuris]